MAISKTAIANMALARIGAKRIDDLDTDSANEAVQARLHYDLTRDAMLRSHVWKCAISRAILSEDAVAPAFEWSHQYILPADCLRVLSIYDSDQPYSLEGRRLLSNDSTMRMVYVRRIDDPAQFDPLFVEAFVVELAAVLAMPLAQDKALRQSLQEEAARVLANARLLNRIESNTAQTDQALTWNEARLTVPVGTVVDS